MRRGVSNMEKVEDLKQDCKNLIEINNNQAKIVDGLQDEINILRNQNRVMFECLIKWQKSFKSTIRYQKYEPNVFTLLNERFCESSDIIAKIEGN